MNRVRKAIITSLGTGYLPAPGTWGALVTCVVFIGACHISAWSVDLNHEPQLFIERAAQVLGWHITWNLALVVLLVVSSVGCVALGKFAEAAFGKKDPGQCNIDEVAGQAVAMLLLPLAPAPWTWWLSAGVAFVLFRAFDISKPPPCRWLEKLPHGWGMLLDDLAAGVYANVAAQLILRLGFHL